MTASPDELSARRRRASTGRDEGKAANRTREMPEGRKELPDVTAEIRDYPPRSARRNEEMEVGLPGAIEHW